jgi:hypothetical protein
MSSTVHAWLLLFCMILQAIYVQDQKTFSKVHVCIPNYLKDCPGSVVNIALVPAGTRGNILGAL